MAEPPPRRVLLVEDKFDGHYLYYVRLLALAALERGDEVVLRTRSGLPTTAEGRFYLADLASRIRIIETDDFRPEVVEAAARELGAHHTVVPDADLWLGPIAVRGGWRGPGLLELLVLRTSTQPRPVRGMQAIRTAAKRALMVRVALMPRVRVSVLKSSVWRGVSPLPVTRDPITVATTPKRTAALAKSWGLGDDRTWYAVLGNITDRKNLPMVAAALARVAASSPVGLLVAGKVEDGELERAAPGLDALRAAGEVVIVDRMLEEDELDAAVAAVDCLVVAHSNEGPSGLLAKAAAAGTRVLTAGARSLRADARRIPTIAAWVPLEVDALARGMRAVPGRPRPRPIVQPGTAAFTDALLGPSASSPGRVVWCSPSYGYDGDLMYFEPIFRGLAAQLPGMSIPVARDFPVARYPGLPLRPILEFVALPTPGGYASGVLVPTLGSLVRLARLRPQTLIAIEFTPLAVLGMLLVRVLPGKKRVLLLLESDPAFRGSGGSWLVLRIKRRIAGLATLVVANTTLARQYAIERLRVPRERVVDAMYLTSAPLGDAKPRKRARGEARSILFANSLVERKGAAQLLRAFAALPEQTRESARLDIVGDGPERAALEALAASLGLGDRVAFHGRLPYRELGEHYAGAWIVVAPSLADYRSLGAIEAAASGLPSVVSKRDGAHVELAAAGAVVIDPTDTDAFRSALESLLDDGAHAEQQKQAQARRDDYSVETVVDGLVSVILDDRRGG